MGTLNTVAIVLLLLVLLVACIGKAKTTSANTFSVGESYVVRKQVSVVKRGKRLILIPTFDGKSTGTVETTILEVGTELRVIKIRADNTWTRGIVHWPEAIITKGSSLGEKMSLEHKRVIEYLQPTESN